MSKNKSEGKLIKKILFVTWDGPKSNYLEILFLPIFEKLKKYGYSFHVLQFTWNNNKKRNETKIKFEDLGFGYDSVYISRKFLLIGSLVAILYGSSLIKRIIKKQSIKIILSRSIFPAFSTLLALNKKEKYKFIYDSDGLSLDERVEYGGQYSSGFIHRYLRDIEAEAVRRSSAVLTRSIKGSEILHARAGACTDFEKFNIVYNGRDVEKFNIPSEDNVDILRLNLKIEKKIPLIIYVGSLGGKYLTSEIFKLFAKIKGQLKDARLIILTPEVNIALEYFDKYKFITHSIDVFHAQHDEVPKYLACADLGLAIIKPGFSMQAVSAIKIGEYLLSGLPVVSTKGIGDNESVLDKVGFILEDLSDENLDNAVSWFVNDVMKNRQYYRNLARDRGLDIYSLDAATYSYAKALGKL